MRVTLDRTKYARVSEELRERFFSFADAAEVREMQVGGFSWWYLDTGPREGSTLIFFTGGIKVPTFSFAVIEAFSRRCRVLAPAQPRCRSLAEYFEGVDAMLKKEHVGSFFVAGSSWGGQLAQVAAMKYPDRVQKLVLANTGNNTGLVFALLVRLHRWGIRRQDPQTVVDDFRARGLKLLKDSDEASAFWQAVFDDLYARSMTYEDYASLIDTQIDYLSKYARAVQKQGFAGPTLVLASRDETAGTGRMRATLLKAYPKALLHVFEAGGHHPALLHLEEYRRAVEDFLSDAPS